MIHIPVCPRVDLKVYAVIVSASIPGRAFKHPPLWKSVRLANLLQNVAPITLKLCALVFDISTLVRLTTQSMPLLIQYTSIVYPLSFLCCRENNTSPTLFQATFWHTSSLSSPPSCSSHNNIISHSRHPSDNCTSALFSHSCAELAKTLPASSVRLPQ